MAAPRSVDSNARRIYEGETALYSVMQLFTDWAQGKWMRDEETLGFKGTFKLKTKGPTENPFIKFLALHQDWISSRIDEKNSQIYHCTITDLESIPRKLSNRMIQTCKLLEKDFNIINIKAYLPEFKELIEDAFEKIKGDSFSNLRNSMERVRIFSSNNNNNPVNDNPSTAYKTLIKSLNKIVQVDFNNISISKINSIYIQLLNLLTVNVKFYSASEQKFLCQLENDLRLAPKRGAYITNTDSTIMTAAINPFLKNQ
ncbi:MAG: hypothetical protein H0W64_07385 [Gammaproteobacteria bacterium]|nr:hypothetical protein [Gammaproteobacteria bacterium]